ncbi:penicillin-binding protein [Wenjunlia vitaminophila]|uniref:Penicillin-binding protein n=1 Tax=Wenjunlia vitaminophila TaxID=76728 RepID=A0A0T6LNN7_WENVI|nr:transglycosylase domain-containing protein [Wenjunlia vitaminophila]KRV47741.1 penicillin-binding protein [Wenjunlia vitaminophila]
MSDEPSGTIGTGQGGDGGGTGGRRPRRTGWRRLLPTWRMVLVGTLSFLVLCVGAFAVGYVLVDIPPANAVAKAQANVYLYSDGTEIARTGDVNRESIPLSKVPKHVQRAVLAAEDRNFYSESAVNPLAMGRAAWNTLRGGQRQSGSTITQQYVKNYYLNQDQTLSRKAKEFFIAIKLDRETTKDEILEGYLNTSYYGRNSYGIQAAARAYYGKDADELTVSEGAYLAALLNAPSLYDVVANPENRKAALARWEYVLDGMEKKDWLTRAERDRQRFAEPDPVRPQNGLGGQDGYLVEAAKKYLMDNDIVDEQSLAAGGYRITTTIDRKKQQAFVDAVDDELMAELSKDRKVDSYVRAGGASVEAKTGRVVALYGGVDYLQQWTNNATRREYQVGSVFKPIVLASAIDNEATTTGGVPITGYTVYDGSNKRPVVDRDGQPVTPYYAPENEDQVGYGSIDVSRAMNHSVNSVFAQMAQDVGTDKVKRTAIDLGFPEEGIGLHSGPAMALGTATPSVLDTAGAYAALANHGEYTEPWLVDMVTKNGKKVDLPRHKGERAIEREAADSVTEVLRGVIDEPGGTGFEAKELGRPAAGKTGTAEEDKAAWFAAYTPQLATVVSVMGKNPNPPYDQKKLYGVAGLPRVNGGGFPAQIWTAYMRDALRGSSVEDFDLKTTGGDQKPPQDWEQPDPTTGGTSDSTDDTRGSQSPDPTDGGTTDGGTTDGGTTDGGTTDGGTGDPATGGTTDGGTVDGGTTDGGTTDGGTVDGGTVDGGTTDGGTGDPTTGGTSTGSTNTGTTTGTSTGTTSGTTTGTTTGAEP